MIYPFALMILSQSTKQPQMMTAPPPCTQYYLIHYTSYTEYCQCFSVFRTTIHLTLNWRSFAHTQQRLRVNDFLSRHPQNHPVLSNSNEHRKIMSSLRSLNWKANTRCIWSRMIRSLVVFLFMKLLKVVLTRWLRPQIKINVILKSAYLINWLHCAWL